MYLNWYDRSLLHDLTKDQPMIKIQSVYMEDIIELENNPHDDEVQMQRILSIEFLEKYNRLKSVGYWQTKIMTWF